MIILEMIIVVIKNFWEVAWGVSLRSAKDEIKDRGF